MSPYGRTNRETPVKCAIGTAARCRYVKIKTAVGVGKTARVVLAAIPVISTGDHMLKKPNATLVVAVPRRAAVAHQVPVLQVQVAPQVPAVRHPVPPAVVVDKMTAVVVTGTVRSIRCAQTRIMGGDGKTPKAVLARILVTGNRAVAEWFASSANV